jgi:hypothetical protein
MLKFRVIVLNMLTCQQFVSFFQNTTFQTHKSNLQNSAVCILAFSVTETKRYSTVSYPTSPKLITFMCPCRKSCKKEDRNHRLCTVKGTGVAQSVQCLTTDWKTGVRSPQGQTISPLASVSRLALRPTQPPIQWVPAVLSHGVKRG